mgnify:CR=1 FL=1
MNEDKVRQEIMRMRVLAPLNGGLRTKIANLLIAKGVPQKVAVNAVLFRAGDPSDDQGIVLLDGEINVEKEGNPGITAYAPDIIGEMAQMNPTRQRTATVTTQTEIKVLRFKWPALMKAAEAELSEAEFKSFTDALQENAWQHFTE